MGFRYRGAATGAWLKGRGNRGVVKGVAKGRGERGVAKWDGEGARAAYLIHTTPPSR